MYESRRSAANLLRGNPVVGVDLHPFIEVKGRLPSPNSSMLRSAITRFGAPGPNSGYHIEINLDCRELGLLAWPGTDRISDNDPRLKPLGEALSFFLREGTSSCRGVLGLIHTGLKDANIKVLKFTGAESSDGPMPYISVQFEISDQVRDAEEKVLQFPHPIRRLNQVVDFLINHGYAMGKELARDIYIQEHGVNPIFREQPGEDNINEVGGPWILSSQIEDLREYFESEKLIELPLNSQCRDGKARYECTENSAILRLDVNSPTREAAESLSKSVQHALIDQQNTMLEGYFLDEAEVPDLKQANLGLISSKLYPEGDSPNIGPEGDSPYIEFVVSFPELEQRPNAEDQRALKIGFLFEQLGSTLVDFSDAFKRKYTK